MKDYIHIKNAHLNNLKHIDIDIPLNTITAIAGVSGSGKSSLAMGIVYAQGSSCYLSTLRAYDRNFLNTQKVMADEILYVPAAVALTQRPKAVSMRSTFGTASELLNVLRLMFSRLGLHKCPNGHYLKPSINAARGASLICPECSASFKAPEAIDFAFNGNGACPFCHGSGTVFDVNLETLVPDDTLSIDEGAVAPWKSLMWSLMTDVCREMGVRTDIPFKDLSAKEKDIVYNGPSIKKHIIYRPKNKSSATELDFTYYSAVNTVKNALDKVKDEKGLKRVEKFLKYTKCPHCHGSRFSDKARDSLLYGQSIDKLCAMSLDKLYAFVQKHAASADMSLKVMTEDLVSAFCSNAKNLIDMGLSYLSLDRELNSLSNGERQRVELNRIVRNRTTGILYVLDEPSIGLHPYNLKALHQMMDRIIADGNSILLVDHDVDVLNKASYLIEMGQGAGVNGGSVIEQGSVTKVKQSQTSLIAPYLNKSAAINYRDICDEDKIFEHGTIELKTYGIHNLDNLYLKIPKGRFSAVTGVSGSGKTTAILECLKPALDSLIHNKKMPEHIKSIRASDIEHVYVIDATPIGSNVRSTLATYSGIHDDLRKIFAKTSEAKALGLKAGDFSYNTGSLRCTECDGLGFISLDVQFMPDIEIPCPVCHGSRYNQKAFDIVYKDLNTNLPDLLNLDVAQALSKCSSLKAVRSKLEILNEIGLSYLKLNESTPLLSGGEAQRLKLSSHLNLDLRQSIFIFDEPTVGLHPLDIKKLIGIFDRLCAKGATLIVIEHDLDLIQNADYIIDMGPLGGDKGGKVVCQGSVRSIKNCKESITGCYLTKGFIADN